MSRVKTLGRPKHHGPAGQLGGYAVGSRHWDVTPLGNSPVARDGSGRRYLRTRTVGRPIRSSERLPESKEREIVDSNALSRTVLSYGSWVSRVVGIKTIWTLPISGTVRLFWKHDKPKTDSADSTSPASIPTRSRMSAKDTIPHLRRATELAPGSRRRNLRIPTR